MRIGSPRVPDSGFNNAELFVGFDYDTLDNRNFPTDGALIRAQWKDSIESLGGDDNFSQFNVRAGIARSWGRNTFTGSPRTRSTIRRSPSSGPFTIGRSSPNNSWQYCRQSTSAARWNTATPSKSAAISASIRATRCWRAAYS